MGSHIRCGKLNSSAHMDFFQSWYYSVLEPTLLLDIKHSVIVRLSMLILPIWNTCMTAHLRTKWKTLWRWTVNLVCPTKWWIRDTYIIVLYRNSVYNNYFPRFSTSCTRGGKYNMGKTNHITKYKFQVLLIIKGIAYVLKALKVGGVRQNKFCIIL